jgi:hypothetical protein
VLELSIEETSWNRNYIWGGTEEIVATAGICGTGRRIRGSWKNNLLEQREKKMRNKEK